MSKLIVIGDICLDVTHRGKVTRKCPESSTADVFKEDMLAMSPGMSGNVASILNDTFQHEVTLMGQIGIDDNGLLLQRMFASAGIEACLTMLGRTSVKNRYIDYDGAIHLRVDSEDMAYYPIAEVGGKYDGLLISDYAKGVISERTIERLPKAALKLANIKPKNLERIRNFDLIQVNMKEALEIDLDVDKAVAKMLEHAKYALITREDGAILYRAKTGGVLYPTTHNIVPLNISDEDRVGLGDRMLAYLMDELLRAKDYGLELYEEAIIVAQERISKYLKGGKR